MDTFDWAAVLALFLLNYLGGVLTAHWLDQSHDAMWERRLELLEKRFERDIRLANYRVGELTGRADRNTAALERVLTAQAALTTRTERTERAAHHHDAMKSFKEQKR
jgi:hypothetical protein